MTARTRQHLGRRNGPGSGLFTGKHGGLRRSILATVAYSDAVGLPVTALQLHERLICPSRVGESGAPDFAALVSELDALVEHGSLRGAQGWYAPAGSSGEHQERHMGRLKVQTEKWRLMRRRAFWFQAVPFVRAVFASGSLAQGTTGPDSDWDMFVIARRGRLYTARLALLGTAWLMRRLRVKGDRIAPDKFCFNHYITDNGLELRHKSLFVAYAIASHVPIHDPFGFIESFRHANRWVGEYLAHWPPEPSRPIERMVTRSRILTFVRQIVEVFFGDVIGDGVEWLVRNWQQRRIARDPATHASGGRITADERELEFHPRSAERAVLARHNAAMVALDMPAGEADSGLR